MAQGNLGWKFVRIEKEPTRIKYIFHKDYGKYKQAVVTKVYDNPATYLYMDGASGPIKFTDIITDIESYFISWLNNKRSERLERLYEMVTKK